MTTRRIITLIIAGIVALLIVYAGKSCAENIAETNRRNAAKATVVQSNGGNSPSLIQQTNPPATEAVTETETTTEYVETVTNIFGEVIGTVPSTEALTSPESPTSDGELSAEPSTSGSILDNEDPILQEPTAPPPILDRTPVEQPTEPQTVDLNEVIIRVE